LACSNFYKIIKTFYEKPGVSVKKIFSNLDSERGEDVYHIGIIWWKTAGPLSEVYLIMMTSFLFFIISD